jgi:alpha-tubulin suppressor-like RCC1 family protein
MLPGGVNRMPGDVNGKPPRRFAVIFGALVFLAACSAPSSPITGSPSARAITGSTLAAGGAHTCVVTARGDVACWGSNNSGQLGTGTNIDSPTPVMVKGLDSKVVAVATGSTTVHTCALTPGGAVQCWGNNTFGQLGDGQRMDSSSPVAVKGLPEGVGAIALGPDETCAVTSTGSLKCWGANCCGELGNGTTVDSSAPVDVVGLAHVAMVALGSLHACALTQAGAVKCWGSNDVGQLGRDGSGSAIPVDVAGLDQGVRAIAAGLQFTCGLMEDGTVKCWGSDRVGQLGNGPADDGSSASLPPNPVQGLKDATAISAGGEHACALKSDGSVVCWGADRWFELGDGSGTNRDAPVQVSGLTGRVVAIAAGGAHTCALLDVRAVACWGSKRYSQLESTAADTNPTFVNFAPELTP